MVAEHLRTSRCTPRDIAVLELKRTESSNYRNSDNFWGTCMQRNSSTDGRARQPQAMLGGARHRYVSVCRGFRDAHVLCSFYHDRRSSEVLLTRCTRLATTSTPVPRVLARSNGAGLGRLLAAAWIHTLARALQGSLHPAKRFI